MITLSTKISLSIITLSVLIVTVFRPNGNGVNPLGTCQRLSLISNLEATKMNEIIGVKNILKEKKIDWFLSGLNPYCLVMSGRFCDNSLDVIMNVVANIRDFNLIQMESELLNLNHTTLVRSIDDSEFIKCGEFNLLERHLMNIHEENNGYSESRIKRGDTFLSRNPDYRPKWIKVKTLRMNNVTDVVNEDIWSKRIKPFIDKTNDMKTCENVTEKTRWLCYTLDWLENKRIIDPWTWFND